ncbi:MAG: peptidoglycan recognition protein family protein [Alphaproteobacteria bacterium]
MQIKHSFKICLGLLLLVVFPAEGLQVLSRGEWNAKPGIESRMKRQVIREIVVHHTGVRKQSKYSLKQKLKFLQEYSQGEKRWGDVPYHFYIDMNGDVAAGRELAYAGDTNTGYNPANRIHIVVEGDLENERPSDRQIAVLRTLVKQQQAEHGLDPNAVSGHMDHASTDCPGQYLYPVLPSLRQSKATYCKGATFANECFDLKSVYLVAQSYLKSYQCYDGEVDGQWGRLSETALDKFNKNNNTTLKADTAFSRSALLQSLDDVNYKSCR